MKPKELKISGNLIVTTENQNNFKNLTKSGSIDVQQGATLTAPALTEVSGSIDVQQGATLTAPALTEVSGYIDVYEGATLTAQALTKSDSIDVRQGATLNIPQLKGLSYKSVDKTLFVVEQERTSKGVKIYSGYVITKISDGKAVKNQCFVAEKDNYTAHGDTVKKAISDVQFKIVAEKLKSEPISEDTIVTINHYRLITGACEMGVNSWMEQNKQVTDGIKAKNFLPILEKTGAYGLDRFKELINF